MPYQLFLTVIVFLVFSTLPAKTVHVLVALCDNQHQGIVPVPAALGNGQDPRNNLYWGAMYGVKTFLRKQPEYKLVHSENNPSPHILERIVFRYRDATIIADAYDGRRITDTVKDFFDYAAGRKTTSLKLQSGAIEGGGRADLLVFVGHNAFMDGEIPVARTRGTGKNMPQTTVFACKSRPYFLEKLLDIQARPLILTNGLMAPEAYVLHALIAGWEAGRSGREIHEMVAQAYHKYQKCGLTGAKRLFYHGD